MSDAQKAPREDRPGTSVLIVECVNDACRKDGAVDDQHNDSGRREWTTGFHVEGSDEGTNYWVPNDGEDAQRCPDCGEFGTVFTY